MNNLFPTIQVILNCGTNVAGSKILAAAAAAAARTSLSTYENGIPELCQLICQQ